MLNFSCEMMRNFNLLLGNVFNHLPVAAIATPIVIIVSTYMAFRYAKNAYKCKNNEPFYTRALSLGALHGGELAVQRLIDYHNARADAASIDAAETELKTLLSQEQPNFNQLQSVVAKLEISGKEVIAVRMLEQEVERAKRENRSHEAYEIEMLLVEMLIYKGDYHRALKCECLNHAQISDARQPLYKAIIHIMLDQRKEAFDCWDKFVEVRTHFQSPPSFQEDKLHKDITDFNEFDKVVKMLKNDIIKAHSQRLQK